MTQLGTVSAWAALAVGLALAALAALQMSWGLSVWVLALSSLLLLAGGYRTLRQLSGGLRLLAGAWGLSAGLMLPLAAPASAEMVHGSYYLVADHGLAWFSVALTVVSLTGLALAVLHKEKKRADAP